MTDTFEGRTFSAPSQRVERLTKVVARHVRPDQSPRILDLGCGTGRQLFDLARTIPEAMLTGVDISQPNVEAAQQAAEELNLANRVGFAAIDYLSFESEPFDAIVSDSTLQNINAPNDALFARLGNDLAPGGVLVCTVPYGCAFNHLLWLVRRCLRCVRCRLTDGFIFRAARMLHRGDMTDDMLRERVHYMYLIPLFHDTPVLRRELESEFGLEVVDEAEVPHASIGQPRHRLIVFRKMESVD